jgi:glycosyltransferase involved in cell wall biosynthesis
MSDTGFSIVIACRHTAGSLKAALQALGEQEYPEEIGAIVIDDGSEHGREEIAAAALSMGLPVRYFDAPGVIRAEAWNLGLREATGEYVAFLDDDCIPPPGWLAALSSAFDGWLVGVAGGPDRAPKDANTFERCLDYVLTSFAGTLGLRRGSQRFGRYYPRPWNMAGRKEALKYAGGFDADSPEAPEVPMIHRLEKIGYRAAYQPDAWVWHRRETDLLGFLSRDFRLSRERGRGTDQPGMARIYGAVCIALLLLLGFWALPATQELSEGLLGLLVGGYLVALVLLGVHAAVMRRIPAAVVIVPTLMALHHTAHAAGYMVGRLFRQRSRA